MGRAKCASDVPGSTGLGNKLFCIASGLGLAKTLRREYIIDRRVFRLDNPHSKLSYDYFFRDIPVGQVGSDGHQVYILNNEANAIIYAPPPQNMIHSLNNKIDVVVPGWRQSEKYFANVAERVRDLFSCPKERLYPLIEPGSAFVHVRRGDYLENGWYKTLDYYVKGMSYMSNINKWVVFSDDIDWCKQQKEFEGCKFVEGYNEIDSLWMMSKCDKGGVCANSTFSWWGSWLINNPGKTVVMPELWFKDKTPVSDIHYGGVLAA